jgi:hypothetical protein
VDIFEAPNHQPMKDKHFAAHFSSHFKRLITYYQPTYTYRLDLWTFTTSSTNFTAIYLHLLMIIWRFWQPFVHLKPMTVSRLSFLHGRMLVQVEDMVNSAVLTAVERVIQQLW